MGKFVKKVCLYFLIAFIMCCNMVGGQISGSKIEDNEKNVTSEVPNGLIEEEIWPKNMRMVIVSIPKNPNTVKIKMLAKKLKKNGVNTILDHGSFQFVPNLPDGKEQWAHPVNYENSKKFTYIMKSEGLKVIHHCTTTFLHKSAMNNPNYNQFLSRDIRTGEIAVLESNNNYSNAVYADMNHPDYRELIFNQMRKYVREVRPNAFMADEVEWLPNIFAGGTKEGSEKLFMEKYGFSYPTNYEIDNIESKKWKAYKKFRNDSGGNFYKDLTKELRTEDPSIIVTGNLSGISKPKLKGWAMGTEGWLEGWSLGCYEMEEGCSPDWKKGAAGFLHNSLWQTYYREMSLYNAFSEKNKYWVTYCIAYPKTFAVENSEQFYIWAQVSLMGHRYCMRSHEVELEWFKWESKYEDYLVNPRWIGDIGIFYPEYSKDYSKNPYMAFKDWAGICESLSENNVCYNQLTRWHIESNKLSRFKLIIIPSAKFLSEKMIDNLQQYVENGGIVIFTADVEVKDLLEGITEQYKLNKLIGIEEKKEWINKKTKFEFVLDDGKKKYDNSFSFTDGYLKVIKAKASEVLACIDDSEHPALLKNKVGNGVVYYLTGRVGAPAYQTQWFKGEQFYIDASSSQRKNISTFVKNLLKNSMNVEIVGLPSNVMTNAFDTYGLNGKRQIRTIHFLDSSGGLKNGEKWPKNATPYKFQNISERVKNNSVQIYLRDVKMVKDVSFLSPDLPEMIKLKSSFDDKKKAWLVQVPVELFERYSVVAVEI